MTLNTLLKKKILQKFFLKPLFNVEKIPLLKMSTLLKYGWVRSSFPGKLQFCTTSFKSTQTKRCQWDRDQAQEWEFMNSDLWLKLLFYLSFQNTWLQCIKQIWHLNCRAFHTGQISWGWHKNTLFQIQPLFQASFPSLFQLIISMYFNVVFSF